VRPTTQQIREYCARIRRFDIDDIERRLLAALERDKAGTTIADGYPSSTMPGGGGGAELTSVESAAERRIAGTKDSVRAHLEHAYGYLEQAAISQGALGNRLDAAEREMSPDPSMVDVKVCESCAQGAPEPRRPEHYGTVNGRLPVNTHLCGACYDFVQRYEPRNEARLPSVEEIAQHHLTGRWRARRTA
jgi:hypothetical protein